MEPRDGLWGLTTRINLRDDYQRAFALRYEIYHRQQGKNYPLMDHRAQTFADHLDDSALNLQSKIGSTLVAIGRFNALSDPGCTAYFHQTLQLDDLPGAMEPEEIAVCSRLCMRPGLRNATGLISLLNWGIASGLQRGIKVAICTTSERYLRFFSHIGMRPYGQPYRHPIAGAQICMWLPLTDIGYFESVASPFVAVAQRYAPADDFDFRLAGRPNVPGAMSSGALGQ